MFHFVADASSVPDTSGRRLPARRLALVWLAALLLVGPGCVGGGSANDESSGGVTLNSIIGGEQLFFPPAPRHGRWTRSFATKHPVASRPRFTCPFRLAGMDTPTRWGSALERACKHSSTPMVKSTSGASISRSPRPPRHSGGSTALPSPPRNRRTWAAHGPDLRDHRPRQPHSRLRGLHSGRQHTSHPSTSMTPPWYRRSSLTVKRVGPRREALFSPSRSRRKRNQRIGVRPDGCFRRRDGTRAAGERHATASDPSDIRSPITEGARPTGFRCASFGFLRNRISDGQMLSRPGDGVHGIPRFGEANVVVPTIACVEPGVDHPRYGRASF